MDSAPRIRDSRTDLIPPAQISRICSPPSLRHPPLSLSALCTALQKLLMTGCNLYLDRSNFNIIYPGCQCFSAQTPHITL